MHWLTASLWLYPVLVALTAADGVLPMIPSEAVVLASGVCAHTGTPNVVLVVLVTAAGVTAGDHVAYVVGRSVLGTRLIGRSKHLTRAVSAAAAQLDRRGGLLIVTSRFLPGGRVTMNAACGVTGVPFARFSPAAAVAALAWSAYTVGLGYLGGAAFLANPLLGILTGLALSSAVGLLIEAVRKTAARRKRAAEPVCSCHRLGDLATCPAVTAAVAA